MTRKLAIESLLALIKSDGLNPCDKDECIKSIAETCLPSKLSRVYLDEILPVAIECKELGIDFGRTMKWRLSI